MKHLKSYKHFTYIVLLATLVASFVLYFLKPNLLVDIAYINWAGLLLSIVILFTRWGSIRLTNTSNEHVRLAFVPWILRILLLEISVALFYFGMMQYILFLNPTLTPQTLLTLSTSMTQTWVYFGLFPWALIAIFAICFAVNAYLYQKESYLDSVAIGHYQKQFETPNVILKGIGRAFTLLTLGIGGAFTTLALAGMIGGAGHLRDIFGFNLAAFGAAMILLMLSFRKTSHHLFAAVQTQRPGLGFMLNIVIWALFLALYSFLLHSHTDAKPTLGPLFNDLFFNHGALHLNIFSSAWWFIVTPIIAIFIARFSYGYSLRSIIIATLALPTLSALFFLSTRHIHIAQHLPIWCSQLSIIVGFVLFLAFTVNKKVFPLTAQTYLTSKNMIKHRSELIFSERWKKVCGFFFYLVIPGGLTAITFLSMLTSVLAAVVIILVFIHAIFLLRKT